MIDIQLVRDNPQRIKEKAKQKGYEIDVDQLLQIDKERKELLLTVENLRARRNEISGGVASAEGNQIRCSRNVRAACHGNDAVRLSDGARSNRDGR